MTTTRAGAEIVEYVQPLEPAPPPKPTNPLLVLHGLLRGRYAWAIGLAVLGAAIGAPVGYLLQKPAYKSEGLIRLEPYVDVIGDRSGSGSMPGFEQFLQAQAALIGSKRVLSEAMGQPDWKSFGRGLLPAAEAEFQGSVTVNIPKGTSLIRVGFVDVNPRAAAAAVKAIITSYKTIYDQMEEEKFERPMNVLYGDRQKYKADLDRCTKQILEISNELQSVTPKEDYALKRDWLNQLQRQVAHLKLQGGDAPRAANGPATAPASQPAELPVEVLVDLDPKLNKLQSERDQVARNALILAQKLGENHPQVKDAQFTLKVWDQEIAARVAMLHGQPMQAGGAGAGERLAAARVIDPVVLQRQFEAAKRETEWFGQKVIRIDELRESARSAQEQLDFVNREIERRDRQRELGGRMEVMSYGDLPFSPTKDRRKALAAVGGIGMAGVGVALVVLLGFLDRRMHHIDAARSRLRPAERLLGVLPELPSDFADPVAAADTAHCVHRIRAMLQIRQRATGHKTFAITSPAPGDGKTSLAITLGMSLASSDCRTVLVDCDIDGRGLSAKLARNARRPIGQVLLDMGLLGEADLQEAVELARERRVRLGVALVQLGHVTAAQVDQALRHQRAAAPGLAEALAGGAFEKALHPTPYPLLSVLPLGTTLGTNAGKLAPQALRRLLDRLSEKFDVVLIDCGPILGSVEAAIVSAEADGVILLVSRGGDRKAAENAVGMLTAAGASVEGVVFNRALPHDLMVSGYSSSSSRGVYASRERKATAPAAQQ